MKYEVDQIFEIWHNQESHECVVIGNTDELPESMKIELAIWENGQRKTEQIIILDVEQVEIAIDCMQKWLANEIAKKVKP